MPPASPLLATVVEDTHEMITRLLRAAAVAVVDSITRGTYQPIVKAGAAPGSGACYGTLTKATAKAAVIAAGVLHGCGAGKRGWISTSRDI